MWVDLLGVWMVVRMMGMVMHGVVHGVAGRCRLIVGGRLSMSRRQVMSSPCGTVATGRLLWLHHRLGHDLPWRAGRTHGEGAGRLRLARRTSVWTGRVVVDRARLWMVWDRDEHLLQRHAPGQVPGAGMVVLHVDRRLRILVQQQKAHKQNLGIEHWCTSTLTLRDCSFHW